MNQHIEQAIERFRECRPRVAKYERYYAGDHNLSFASEKFQNTFGSLFREFAMNMCPIVVDAVCDKLIVTGFGVQSAGFRPLEIRDESRTPNEERDESRTLSSVWRDNRMAIRSAEVHREAVKNGDAYAIVWPDEAGRPTIYPNRSSSCTVVYDEESPGRVLWAAKYWRTPDKRLRMNLFYPERTEKYIDADSGRHDEESIRHDAIFNSRLSLTETVPNPYGVVPVFHFGNNADINAIGRSELEDAIPIQDGLNKSVLDMLVAMEFASYRQRWAAGIEIDYDKAGNVVAPFKAGIDHVWIASDPQARFGDFDTAQLEQFIKVKDSFRIDIASVTGTPLHYLMPYANDLPSGEALRKAETRFISKVRARQLSFGQVWSDAMRLALRIAGEPDADIEIRWLDPASLSERETLENLILKRRIGLPSDAALKEAGY